MRYGNRRFRTVVRKPVKPYVPPTPEQVEARRKAVEAYNASLPKPVPYLTPEDPDAFLNWDKQALPETKFASMAGYTVECPKCKGHGGWHLRLNAYPNQPEGHRDFNCQCNQCNGWGYVKPGLDATCVHNWKELSQQACHDRNITHHGMCWHVYECTTCGRTMSQDSSD